MNYLKINTYDAFVNKRINKRETYKLQYEKLKAYAATLQSLIDRFIYIAKRASLAQSKKKILEKLAKTHSYLKIPFFSQNVEICYPLLELYFFVNQSLFL